MAKDKKENNGRLRRKILLISAGFFIAALFFIFIYKFLFLVRYAERFKQYINSGRSDRTALKIALYKKHPVRNLTIFFKKTLKNLNIPSRNIIKQHIVLNVKTPGSRGNNLRDINLDFLKYNVLVSKDPDFNLIENIFRREFRKYIIPSKGQVSYYSYAVKNNTLCLYFYYKSRLILKSVFIVKGIDNSGFNSVKQYVNAPKISLDVDDVGYDATFIDGLISLHTPITFAIFPYAPFSKQIDLTLHKLGYETIMHIPMEPVNTRLFPGDGALSVSMNKKEIRNKIFTDINRLPFVDGANNHEGSLFTSDKNKICDAVSVFKKKGLFFVDSLTDGNSYAYRCALKSGLPSAQRDVFLDDKPSIKYIKNQIKIAASLAGRFKRVIIIGHPRQSTVRVLMKEVPRLKKKGYFFVPLCEFLR
ncbi:MAG: divergent polysaccharide deacetylase family protein [Deltaproteobacteria bacterium]|nr:divergent polysaccharide deacetylase family protein [Deltaproteobacteria bacterium]